MSSRWSLLAVHEDVLLPNLAKTEDIYRTQVWCNHANISIHKHEQTDHYSDVIMNTMSSQITSLTIVYSTVYSGADEKKHQSSASLAFVNGIDWWPVNSSHKEPVTGEMFPFDDVIMWIGTREAVKPSSIRRGMMLYMWT